ncbi:MAG: hypothetical protein EXQ85_08985, partial [Alphaproteobacteria bacterium]|nr:hypothetical protein [Alphaproteobacteria bacterium]
MTVRGRSQRVVACLLAFGLTSLSAVAAAQTLRIANLEAPPNRGDPTGPGLSYQHVIAWESMYDGLTTIEPDGTPKGVLAVSWKNKDPTTWLFKLRPNVKFHSRTPFDADAMVAAVRTLHSDDTKKFGAALYNTLRHTTEARKIDDLTIELKTAAPAPIVPSEAAALRIMDPKAWADLGREKFGNNPSGTGPFRVTAWDNTKLEMARFDGGVRKGKVANMVMYFLPEPPTRVQAVTGGSVDLAFSIAPDAVDLVTRSGGKVHASGSPSIIVLVFNQAQGKYTTDRRVRLAFNLAIDKSYTETLLSGYGKYVAQPAASSVKGYQPDIKPYAHNPEQAKRLLREAGYPNGLKAIAEVVLTSSDTANVLQKIVQDLSKVGIDMELRQIQLADLSARGTGLKPYEGELHISNYGSNPAMDMMRPINAFHSCSNARKWTCFPEIEPDIAAANTEFDPEKRAALLRKIAQFYHDMAPDIFLSEQFQLDAT